MASVPSGLTTAQMIDALFHRAMTTATFTVYDNGDSGASKTIKLANGQKQRIALTANTTLTFDFEDAETGHYTLLMAQDATGGRAVIWSGLFPAGWVGSATAHEINLAPNGMTILTVYYDALIDIPVQEAVKVGA